MKLTKAPKNGQEAVVQEAMSLRGKQEASQLVELESISKVWECLGAGGEMVSIRHSGCSTDTISQQQEAGLFDSKNHLFPRQSHHKNLRLGGGVL